MTNGSFSASNLTVATLPLHYLTSDVSGVRALVAAGILSAVAIVILWGAMLRFIVKRSPVFASLISQTHAGTYLFNVLLANFMQSFGSIMNVKWASDQGVQFGIFCESQGMIKNFGNNASALWSLILAVHIFDALFLRKKQRKLTVFFATAITWVFTGFVAIFGPAFLENAADGPFFGISGQWCWITDAYPRSRIMLEYFIMFFSAGTCLVLYSLVYLRLRGNISGGQDGKPFRFRRIAPEDKWALKVARDDVDSALFKMTTQFMWFPLVFVVVITPIAILRFLDFGGASVPVFATIAADFIFNLNGLFNVMLFTLTWHRVGSSLGGTAPRLTEKRQTLSFANTITPWVWTPPVDPEKGTEEV